MRIDVNAIELILFHIANPIIISLTANRLYDYLKGRKLSKLSKKESKEIINSFIGISIQSERKLEKDEVEEIQSIVSTFGISGGEIEILYLKIKESIFYP